MISTEVGTSASVHRPCLVSLCCKAKYIIPLVVLEIYVAFCTQENNRAMGRRGIGSFLKGCIISLSEILEVKIKKCYYKEITETILEEER